MIAVCEVFIDMGLHLHLSWTYLKTVQVYIFVKATLVNVVFLKFKTKNVYRTRRKKCPGHLQIRPKGGAYKQKDLSPKSSVFTER